MSRDDRTTLQRCNRRVEDYIKSPRRDYFYASSILASTKPKMLRDTRHVDLNLYVRVSASPVDWEELRTKAAASWAIYMLCRLNEIG